MARPGVSYLDVANTAQQLIAEGKMPTIENIRRLLGTGSNSTLGTHLRTWKTKQSQTEQIALKENLPDELIAALKGVWERVTHITEEQIQTCQEKYDGEIATLKQQLACLQKTNEQAQEQYKQLQHERDNLVTAKLTIEEMLANYKIEVVTMNEKYAGLERQHRQKQEQIEELRRQNQQVQDNLEHYRTLSLEQRLADQARFEQQQAQLELTAKLLTEIKTEYVSLQQSNSQINAENNVLRSQLGKLESQHESTMTQLTTALNNLDQKTQEQQHWLNQFQTIQRRHEEQTKDLLEMQMQFALQVKQTEITTRHMAELQEQNKLLTQEKWLLGQEKAQLQGQLESAYVSLTDQ